MKLQNLSNKYQNNLKKKKSNKETNSNNNYLSIFSKIYNKKIFVNFRFFNIKKLKYNVINYKVYNFDKNNCEQTILDIYKKNLKVYNNYVLIFCFCFYIFD